MNNIFYAKKEEIDLYFISDRVNQSLLKDVYYNGNRAFKDKKDKTSKALSFGSAVDFLLTSDERFEDFYNIKPELKLTDSETKVFEELLNSGIKTSDDVKDNRLLGILDKVQYYKKYKDTTRLNKIKPVIASKFDEYAADEDKIVITEQEYQKVAETVNNALKISVFKEVFKPEQEHNVYHFFQLPIFFEYENILTKALLDKVKIVVEGDKVTEVHITDLKTMKGDVKHFANSVKKYDYLFQLAWYDIALDAFLKQEFSNYNLENIRKYYTFAVISSNYVGNAVIYDVDKSLIEKNKYSRDKINIEDAVKKYKFFNAHPEIAVDTDIYNNNYKIQLKYEDE